jgi:hypothetical protein
VKATSPPRSMASFLAPISLATFLTDYYGRAHLHLTGAPHRFAGLFDLDVLEHYLLTVRPGPSDQRLRMFAAGVERMLPLNPDPLWVMRAFGEGETIILNAADRSWPSVRRLNKLIHQSLHATVHTNIYCTPPGATGLPPHTDTHDVFVCQTAGRKRWRVYETRYSLPLEGTALNDAFPAPDVAVGDGPGEPIAELVLEPGDVLYLPRGAPHDAVSLAEPSLHLTIGVRPLQWYRLLGHMIDELAARCVELRAAVPFDVLSGARPIASAPELLAWIAALADQQPDLAEASRRSALFIQRDRVPDQGVLRTMRLADTLTLDSVVEHATSPAHWELRDGKLHLMCGTVGIEAPAKVWLAAEFFVATQRFCARELPPLYSLDARMALVRRMARQGMLRLVDQ